MRQIRWSGPAKHDIERLGGSLADGDDNRLADIIEDMLAASEFLASAPKAGPAVGGSFDRKWPLKRFPFLLFYRLYDDHLLITRVVHSASDWKAGY